MRSVLKPRLSTHSFSESHPTLGCIIDQDLAVLPRRELTSDCTPSHITCWPYIEVDGSGTFAKSCSAKSGCLSPSKPPPSAASETWHPTNKTKLYSLIQHCFCAECFCVSMLASHHADIRPSGHHAHLHVLLHRRQLAEPLQLPIEHFGGAVECRCSCIIRSCSPKAARAPGFSKPCTAVRISPRSVA